MLIVLDIHQVVGRAEVAFEESYRDTLLPALVGSARLAFFGWLPHGSGEGYEAVTLTTVADTEALHGYQERLRRGDLTEWWTSVESVRYSLTSSLHLSTAELAPPPSDPVAGAGGLYRLDSGTAAGDPGDTATGLASELSGDGDALCRLLTVLSPFLGVLGGSTLHAFYAVANDDRLVAALEADDPGHHWPGTADPSHFAGGGPERHRLVRATGWSPLR